MFLGRRRTLPLIASVLLLGIGAVAGCTAAPPLSSIPPATTSKSAEPQQQPPLDSDGDAPAGKVAIEDFDGFLSEYSDATQELASAFPEADFPDEPPGDWESDGNFQQGLGYMAAAFVVQCTLMTQYADSKRDRDDLLQDESLALLEDWIEIPGVKRHTDAVYRSTWLNSVIEPAKSGHDTFLLALSADCK